MSILSSKKCTKCSLEFPLSAFYVRKRRGNPSVEASCKSCQCAYQVAYRLTNIREKALYNAAYRADKPAYQMKGQARRKGYAPPNITDEALMVMIRNHDGVCDIMGCVSEARVTDHDHKTGKVRGRLCRRHNMGLGYFDDSIPGIEAAVQYLRDRG